MSLRLHFALLRRPLTVWLAVLIAVFAALAPTLSHALVLAQRGMLPMMEVCSSSGAHEVASTPATDATDGQKSAPLESASLVTHCPFCLLSTDRVAPAPHALVHLFAVLGESGPPTIWQAFFHATPFALTPPPRGPPQFLG